MNTVLTIIFIPLLAIYLIFGIWFYFFPPKKINGFIGYRTGLSMKDQNSWDYSQKRFGEISLKIGIILTLIFIMFQYFNITNVISLLIFLLFGILCFLIPIVIIQKELNTKKD